MKRTWPIIGVDNVARSYDGYRVLLGQAEGAPAHDDFGQLRDDDGTVLLLARLGCPRPPDVARSEPRDARQRAHPFFRVDDFDAALERAGTLVDALDEEPRINPRPGHESSVYGIPTATT